MSQPISFFTHYKQSENQVTNAVGLILKILYQESPTGFTEFIGQIIGAEGAIPMGYDFRQQEVGEASVPDLVIEQSPVRIVIETKNHDWFYDDQLASHLNSFPLSQGIQVLIALSNFNHAGYRADILAKHEAVVKTAKDRRILFIPLDFFDFCEVLSQIKASPTFSNFYQEFYAFLEGRNLLGSWRNTLDVVNCGQFYTEFEKGFYICPNGQPSYSHQRAAYLGAYWHKAVRLVAEIRGVVKIEPGGTVFSILTDNGILNAAILIQEAENKWKAVDLWRHEANRTQAMNFFILGPIFETFFAKDTPGPMFGSKMYFPIGKVSNTEELAGRLKNTTWSKLKAGEDLPKI